MNVLHVIQRYWPAGGGAERHLHEIGKRLVGEGHRVTVYTTDADDFQLFWDPGKARFAASTDCHEGVEIRRFAVRHLPGMPLTFPLIRRGMTLLSDLPIDLTAVLTRIGQYTPWAPGLHAALRAAGPQWDVAAGMTVTFDSLLWPAARWAERHGRPWLMYPLTHLADGARGAVGRYYTMRQQLALSRRARVVYAQTETERRFLVGRGVAEARIVVAGVGINLEEYGGGDAARGRAALGVEAETPLVLALGTASRDKGTEDTLGAMERLWAKGHGGHLVLVGAVQDAFRRTYERLDATARTRVHLRGYVSEGEKQDLLAAAEVMCLPSRADSFGIAYLEAWAYGKPVIGARAGGTPDVIMDDRTAPGRGDGLLVPFGDRAALAEVLALLLDDPGRRRAMGERGRSKVERQYTWDEVYRRVRPGYGLVEPNSSVERR